MEKMSNNNETILLLLLLFVCVAAVCKQVIGIKHVGCKPIGFMIAAASAFGRNRSALGIVNNFRSLAWCSQAI
jgi:hypothetical protein